MPSRASSQGALHEECRAALTRLALAASFEEAVEGAASAVAKRFGADYATVFVITRGNDPCHAVYSKGGTGPARRKRLSDPARAFVDVVRRARAAAGDGNADAAFLGMDPGAREACTSWIQAPIRSRGAAIGLVAAGCKRKNGLGVADLAGLRDLARLWEVVAGQLLDLADVAAERELLSAEATLLAKTAAIKTQRELLRAYAEGVRQAIGADAVAIIEPGGKGVAWQMVDDPPGILGAAEAAARSERNQVLLTDAGATAFYNPDVQRRAGSPGEGAAARAGQRSFMATQGTTPGLPRLIITATSLYRDRFHEDARAFVSRVATVLQLSLDRLRTMETTRSQREQLAAQARLLTAMDPRGGLSDIAETFAREARARFDVDYVAVTHFGGRKGPELLYLDPSVGELPVGGLADAASNPAYAAVTGGESEVVSLARRERTAIEAHLFGHGIRWLARAPVRGGSDVLGIVSVGGRRETRRVRVEDLEALIRPLGLVLERAVLLTNLERRNDELGTANAILSGLSIAPDIGVACEAASQRLREFFRADHVALGFINLRERTRTVLGWDSAVLKREQLAAEVDEADAEVYGPEAGADPIAIADLRELGELNPGTALMRDAGLRSLIRAPFSVSEDVVGLVTVGARPAGAFSNDDARLLHELCRPIGLAVDRARLVAHLERLSERTLVHNELLTALGPTLTQSGLGEHFAAVALRHFKADGAAVLVLGAGEAEVRVLGCEPKAEGLPDAVVEAGRAALAASQGAGRSRRHRAGQTGGKHIITARFNGAGGTTGVAIVFWGKRRGAGDEDQATLLELTQTFAEKLELRAMDEQAREQWARVEATNEVLAALAEPVEEAELVRRFLEVVRRRFEPAHIAILAVPPREERPRLLALESDRVTTEEYPLERVLQAVAAWDQAPVAVADTRGRPPDSADAWYGERGLLSAMRAPLVVGEREGLAMAVGVVSVRARELNRYSDRDARVLGALAGPLGMALERSRAVAALAESEEKYRSLVRQAEEIIFLFDGESHRIIEANAYTARVLGYEQEEITGLTIEELADAPALTVEANIDEVLATGQVRIPERRYRRKDGSTIDVEIVATRVHYGGRQAILALARDVTERRSLLRQLWQAQKMESLGTMAGQVAHDFNNLLTTILGFSGLLKRSGNLAIDERENLELIEQAARRGAELTARLLAFARGGLAKYGPVELGEVIRETLQLAQPTLPRGVVVAWEAGPRPVFVDGDASQLQQAVLNIVLNARDAMPGGGEVRVGLAKKGGKAVVTVADNGPGMDEETRVRIFEPFFTTKASGAGTGLGLAITYGIVQGHGGELRVSSTVGKGSAFTILLPLRVAGRG